MCNVIHKISLFQSIRTISRSKANIVKQDISRNRRILRVTSSNNTQDILLPPRHICARYLGPLPKIEQLRRSNAAHRCVSAHIHIHRTVFRAGRRWDLSLYAELVFRVTLEVSQSLGNGVAAVSYCGLKVAI